MKRTEIKKTELAKIILEVQEYEKNRDKNEQCGASTVQVVNCIVFNNVTHAGVVSHICTERESHQGNHRCCGYEWL